MTKLKKIAIVGRPNVGKSALFNACCKKKISIVDAAEGVTRDRLSHQIDIFGYPFELMDTAGIDPQSKDIMTQSVLIQTELATEEADAFIFVVDGLIPPHELDQRIAHTILAATKKPIVLAINKIDSQSQDFYQHNFRGLGIKEMIPISAIHGYNLAELLEAATSFFDKNDKGEIDNNAHIHPKVALLGRPNVGKSTLFNAFLGYERTLVTDIPGTTRDSIDTPLTYEGKELLFIDTAGIRRQRKILEPVDTFATIRTKAALERCDIALLVVDSMQGLTTEEKKIASLIEEAKKGCIVLFNKWDLNTGFRMEHCLKAIERDAPFLHHCPKLFISAKTGRNVEKIIPTIFDVYDSYTKRISTHQLNNSLKKSIEKLHAPIVNNRRLKIYFATQIATSAPHFVFFVNTPALMANSYKKYLINNLRKDFGFEGVPFTVQLRGKKGQKHRKTAHQPVTTADRDLCYLELEE